MYYTYKGTKVHYKIMGKGNIPIVLLHGWGGSTQSFEFICKHLTFNYKALILDFPPFGKSEEPKQNFTIFDYEQIVINIMNINNIKKPIIVGHSFGGRVATLLGSKGLANSLILTASAGMKPRRCLWYYLKVLKHKILKLFGKKAKGSKDYQNLSANMKKTFSNIVSTFLEEYAINIAVPTILFWGGRDKETPMYMAKRLNKLIKDSKIICFKKADHFCYISHKNSFIAIINHFGKIYLQ